MTAGKTGFVKYAVTVGAFLGLFCWVAVLQNRYDELQQKLNPEESARGRQKRSSGSNLSGQGGATFVRWGRIECPTQTELVYKGTAGGQYYTHVGGASEYICLPEDPEYDAGTSTGETAAYIYGVELQTTIGLSTANTKGSPLADSDVQCAVCRSTRSTALMIPAKKNCPVGWNQEYWGYLMTGHYNHQASYTYACLDHEPDAGKDSGARNENGGLMYNVQGNCGSLPCPPYKQYYELTCVVCTK